MPDRVVRQKILDSDRVNKLSWAGEVFYRRLMSVADDFGRYDGRVPIIRAAIYPLRLDKVSDADVVKWLSECSNTGLVSIYHVEEKEYLVIKNFNQRLRAMKSKYPPPPAGIGGHLLTDVSNVLTHDARNESESETETERKLKVGPNGQLTENEGKEKRKKVSPPELSQVIAYFLSTVGDTQKNNPWPEDRCKNAAGEFFDHYTANGWVQGRGKPIKDWQAAARNWMRNGIKGTFESPAATFKKEITVTPIARIAEPVPRLDKLAIEINFLFDRFLENQCTIITIDIIHYDYLKRGGRITFTDHQVELIKEAATGHMAQFSIDASEKNALFYMKKFGVLEYFKELKVNNKTTVYEE